MTAWRGRPGLWILVGTALFVLGATASVDPARMRRGAPLDGEASQVLAAVSLASDRDLRYDRADLEDATAVFGVVPTEVPLARTRGGELRYVARGIEPWLLSNVIPWLGARAFPFFHALALTAAALLAWARLGGQRARGATWIVSALAASALPVWLFRYTPEAFHAALVLAGAALIAPHPEREIEDEWTTRAAVPARVARMGAGGALLGLALWELSSPGWVLCLVPFAALPRTIGASRRRLVWAVAAATSLVTLVVALALHLAPFARVRAVDPSRVPQQVRVFAGALPGESGERVDELGRAAEAPAPPAAVPLAMRGYAVRDVLLGRFSGLAWWYPCIPIAWLAVAIRRRRPWRFATLALPLVAVVSLALASPARFAGWSDGPGVRLAAALYPLAIVAGTGVLGGRWLILVWTLAGVLLGEPLSNPLGAVREPALHARALPYSWLPLDTSRAGAWPTGRPIATRSERLALVDVRENIDVVSSTCEGVSPQIPLASACFWTPREDRVEVLVWSDRAEPPDRLVLRSGPRRTRVHLALGAARSHLRMLPNRTQEVRLEGVGNGFPARLGGRDGWAWVLEARSTHAFQPAYFGLGRGRYWIGVQIAFAE
ncbi:MAG: hypothetical protein U0610_12720 [bacterium]